MKFTLSFLNQSKKVKKGNNVEDLESFSNNGNNNNQDGLSSF